ncbi:hypothetical protein F5Y05DRAFT_419023 [Hypoxylon sp. FL0543]|nr:hypothetical protein F5Y05DRAFT_419023 [Hypoxylon sp. FL0543]
MLFFTYLILILATFGVLRALDPNETNSLLETVPTNATEPYIPEAAHSIYLEHHPLVNFFVIMREILDLVREVFIYTMTVFKLPPKDANLTDVDNVLGSPVSSITSSAPPANFTPAGASFSYIETRYEGPVPWDLDLGISILIKIYNFNSPANEIPSFVLCASLRSLPRLYTQEEIFMTIKTAVKDLSPDTHPDDRALGASWPRPLDIRRAYLLPREFGDAVGRLFEYPIDTRDLGIRLHPVSDDSENRTPELVVDRVVFDRDGLFAGILRYHDRDHWHYCYPEGWLNMLTFRRRHAGRESLTMGNPEAWQETLEYWEKSRAWKGAESQTDEAESEADEAK